MKAFIFATEVSHSPKWAHPTMIVINRCGDSSLARPFLLSTACAKINFPCFIPREFTRGRQVPRKRLTSSRFQFPSNPAAPPPHPTDGSLGSDRWRCSVYLRWEITKLVRDLRGWTNVIRLRLIVSHLLVKFLFLDVFRLGKKGQIWFPRLCKLHYLNLSRSYCWLLEHHNGHKTYT